MNLTVCNISNDLAKNNAVYISSQLAKDPSRTVNVRINNSKILKCCFSVEIERSKIGMSKNVRTFVGTDVGQQVLAEPVDLGDKADYDLSYLELLFDQVLPRLAEKSKVEAFKVTEALRGKERDAFFNVGETKYVEVGTTLFSVRAVKCLGMMIGDNKNKENSFGKLLAETQIDIKAVPGSLVELVVSESNEKNIFRPDFTI